MLATAVVLAGCGRDDAAPELEPGQPVEVTGSAGLVTHDLSTSGTLVFPGGSDGDLKIERDDVAVRATADVIRTWLDQVLTERNLGLTTTVAASEVDAAAFAAAFGITTPAVNTAAEEGAEEALATQVTAANYLIQIAYLGQPGWAFARVESVLGTLDDPDTEIGRRLDTFLFAVDEAGDIEFLALEVAP